MKSTQASVQSLALPTWRLPTLAPRLSILSVPLVPTESNEAVDQGTTRSLCVKSQT